MADGLTAGDFLVFQLEAGFALLRLLAVDEDRACHVAAYAEMFPSVESAETAIDKGRLTLSAPHLALTERAFESTQVSRLANRPVEDVLTAALAAWRADPERKVSDRSVRLMLGLR